MAISRAWILGAIVIVGLGAAAACGSKAPKPATPGATTDAPPATGTPTTDAAPSTSAEAEPLVAAECEALLGHVVDIGMAEKKMKLPQAQWPTDDQIAKIKQQLIAANGAECLKMPRGMWTCAMAAKTSVELGTCEQGDAGDAGDAE